MIIENAVGPNLMIPTKGEGTESELWYHGENGIEIDDDVIRDNYR